MPAALVLALLLMVVASRGSALLPLVLTARGHVHRLRRSTAKSPASKDGKSPTAREWRGGVGVLSKFYSATFVPYRARGRGYCSTARPSCPTTRGKEGACSTPGVGVLPPASTFWALHPWHSRMLLLRLFQCQTDLTVAALGSRPLVRFVSMHEYFLPRELLLGTPRLAFAVASAFWSVPRRTRAKGSPPNFHPTTIHRM